MAVHSSWKKSDPALVERFHAALPDHPAAERKQMFGYPACFVNGHFFTGLHEDRFVIRLPGDIRAGFAELADAPTFDPMGTGKGMKDWYEIPAEVASDDGRLADLLAAAVEEVAKLPPKEPKPRSARRG
jgi:TfoX N-terminal domain